MPIGLGVLPLVGEGAEARVRVASPESVKIWERVKVWMGQEVHKGKSAMLGGGGEGMGELGRAEGGQQMERERRPLACLRVHLQPPCLDRFEPAGQGSILPP